jgi:hypothetical protein
MALIHKQVLESYIIRFNANMQGDNRVHQLQIKANIKESESVKTRNFFAKYSPPNLLLLFIVLAVIIIGIAVIGTILFLNETAKQRKYAGTPQQKKCDTCGKIKKDDWNECMFCKYTVQKKKPVKIADYFKK